MSSKFDIVSQALLLIGEAPINSFDEGVSGVVASNLYDTTRDSLLTATRWRFAVGKASLSKLTATPLNEWNNAFQLPSDLLMPIRVYPKTSYEIYEDKIYSNQNSLQLDYIFRPDESAFPAYFVECLAAHLAEKFALSITNNQTMRQAMQETAIDSYKKAAFKDAQGRPSTPIVSRPYVQVRS
jgi:hypothetical protein|tara:strand:+ start:1636 stop:2184 length:549 start_codon:yes stop_codon:yes gene_type:complete